MELRGYCRGNKPILGLFSRHYYIGISSKSQGGTTAFSRRLPHSAVGHKNAPGRMSRGVEAVDYVDSLSQKCRHFFEEMQSAARIIWPDGQMPHLRPEQCFFRRTCRRKKQTTFHSVVCGRRNSARLLHKIQRTSFWGKMTPRDGCPGALRRGWRGPQRIPLS